MKTIGEAAVDYGKQITLKSTDNIGAKHIAWRSFEAGVEFAQRWIPVEEEMPEHRERVLIKWNETGVETKATGSHHINEYGNYWACGGATQLPVTHWRPIERI